MREQAKALCNLLSLYFIAISASHAVFEVSGMCKERSKKQRQQKKLLGQPGTESELTQDRIDALDHIDFTWAPQAHYQYRPKKRR